MIANLKHAARNRESVGLGGGTFSPDEIRAHSDAYETMLAALYDALPYVEDVLADPEQLKCFKPGVVQAHASAIRAAIAKAEASK
jgi:hypothetical protein